MADAICAAACWTPARCEHDREMTPRGRSVPLEMPSFCECYQDPTRNPRHLWDEHDDARFYSDPEGYVAHEVNCGQCGGEDPQD